jgi:hypothetical protein
VELETNSKINSFRDLYRGIIDFKKGYKPRTNIVRDEKGDLVADSHSILGRWMNHFSQLLNIHGVNDVRQTELHTAEPVVSEPSVFGVELAIEKPGIDQISAEFIRESGRRFRSEIYKLIRRNCLWSDRNRSLYLSIRRSKKQTLLIMGAYHFCQLRTKFYATSCSID